MGECDWQALQLEWDTAQLDDWGIDLPDFTAPPCMDALFLQKSSRYRADSVAHTSSKSNSPFGTFWFQRRNFRVPREELFDSYGGNGKFLQRKGIKLRKNQMILRKKRFTPTWKIKNSYVDISNFLGNYLTSGAILDDKSAQTSVPHR